MAFPAPVADLADAVEIPPSTKRRLGLDDDRSWVVIREANRFSWPGPDLRPIRGRDGGVMIAYCQLPGDLFRMVRDRWLARATERRSVVTCTE